MKIYSMAAVKRLNRELINIRDYSEFSCSPKNENLFHWDVFIFGPTDTIYEGGIFRAEFIFSNSYPIDPPKFRFLSKITHPNIYKDGKVCISILNKGQDIYGYEKLNERWSPSQGISSVLLSIISMLNDPNFESPANVDASVLWQKNFNKMKQIVYHEVALTQQ